MPRGEIRKNIKNSVVEIGDMNSKYSYVDLEDVMTYIDTIEMDVNEIKDKLEQYNVLSEINDIYNMLDKLSDKLY
jgi:uncharacterized pyridoxamine 5'-phosphate oxidase family protein